MAAEQKTYTYEGIMSDLKAGRYEPVYYLMGDESYYIDKISDYIAEHALQPEERDFNQTVMFDDGRTPGHYRQGGAESEADRPVGEVLQNSRKINRPRPLSQKREY